MKYTFLIQCLVVLLSVYATLTVCQNITVGGINETLSISPTFGGLVLLICSQSTPRRKDWYTDYTRVMNTSGVIATTPGQTRTLAFLNFDTSHEGTYSCVLSSNASRNINETTAYTVILETPQPDKPSNQLLPNDKPLVIPAVIVPLLLVLIVVIIIVILGIILYLKRNNKLSNLNLRSTMYLATRKLNIKSKVEYLDSGTDTESGYKERMSVEIYARRKKEMSATSVPLKDDDSLNRPVTIGKFPNHVKKLSKNNFKGFHEEFETFVKDPNEIGTASIAESNKNKNKYQNIYTFDHSRVVLTVPDRNGSEYINASYIYGYKAKNYYIATEGPTPDGVAAFWQMVWDNKSPVIVMLTQPEEKGECKPYWNSNLSETFQTRNNMTVVVNNYLGFADYEVRTMTVLNMADKRAHSHNLHHFLYTGWPDHGVPQFPYSLVKLSQQVRKKDSRSTAPIVVHCSNGAGRTGMFIAIDAMLQRLKERDDLNIYEFVTEMRSARTFMVQTKEQYIFIHDALQDYLACGTTSVAANDLNELISRMCKVTEDRRKTGFEKQFEVLRRICQSTTSEDKAYAKKASIAKKNRYSDRYPYSMKHLSVLGNSQKSGHVYINASQVQSYSNPRAFIAAQAPTKNTKEEFWELVWQHKPLTIVLLCDFVEDNQSTCIPFWPSVEHGSESYGLIDVAPKAVRNQHGFVQYTLALTNSKEINSIPFEVNLFHTKLWKADSYPKFSSLLRIMSKVQSIQKGHSTPCVIACDDGMGRTGVFITVMSEIERITYDGEIDVFQTIKAIRTQRPNMVSTDEQFKLCFEIIQEHMHSFDNYETLKRASCNNLRC